MSQPGPQEKPAEPKQSAKKAEKAAKAAADRLRAGVESIATRRFFYTSAFEIYGGVAGLYDFGPMGCALKQNIIDHWRRHFILEENMLEVSCVNVTPEIVLKTSGHVDRFSDFMVKDEENGKPWRADHLIEQHIDALIEKGVDEAQRARLLAIRTQAGAMDAKEMGAVITEMKIKAPDTGNALSDPFPFNLMFQTQIGPSGKNTGYLRPETAQGIFVNFRRLLECNGGRMPFAAAQVGMAFRNEIAPRAGLLRVREFPLAEIEHFVNGKDKSHARFSEVADVKLALLSRVLQTGEDIPDVLTIADAVKKGVVGNETLGYYMARTQLFLVQVGIDNTKLRFRQHKANEMAHYASDCWDAEVHTSYGWVECVGHADRSAFDLEVHTKKSGVELLSYELFDEPKMVPSVVIVAKNALIGKALLGKAQAVFKHFKQMEETNDTAAALALEAELAKTGKIHITVDDERVELTREMVQFKVEEKKQTGQKYCPHVIEPSFGIGRITYAVLEHSYRTREALNEKDKKSQKDDPSHGGTLLFKPSVAPVKVAVLPLSPNPQFTPHARELARQFTAFNLANQINDSGINIGRKYARADEIGIPYAITIDFDTLKTGLVTIRERDTTEQIQVSLKDSVWIVAQLLTDTLTWAEAYNKHPKYFRPEGENDE